MARMNARYPGRCAVTGDRINVGDLIDYDRSTRRATLLLSEPKENAAVVAAEGRYISHVFRTSGGEFYRNKAGRCIDAPCCGCCTI